MATLQEYETIVAGNPALKLVAFNKVEDGLEPDGVTPMHKIVYIDPPVNFKLHADPIETGVDVGVCILEDLDYDANA